MVRSWCTCCATKALRLPTTHSLPSATAFVGHLSRGSRQPSDWDHWIRTPFAAISTDDANSAVSCFQFLISFLKYMREPGAPADRSAKFEIRTTDRMGSDRIALDWLGSDGMRWDGVGTGQVPHNWGLLWEPRQSRLTGGKC